VGGIKDEQLEAIQNVYELNFAHVSHLFGR
jgi:hypothetical protein